MNAAPPTLIINADDFGYYDGVSRGILDAAEGGVVTATGVMANGPALRAHVERLAALREVSHGVHLNATLGRPLTPQMRQRLASNGGLFTSPGNLVLRLATGRLDVDTLIDEWRAQIQYCIQLGLRPVFLNSHEHVHMFPLLYPRVRALAREFGIRHVRVPGVDRAPRMSAGGAIRSAAFAAFALFTREDAAAEPQLLGVLPSGRLDMDYCEWRLTRLEPGQRYELMCHPGHDDGEAMRNSRQRAYHDWKGEFRTLTAGGLRDLLGRCGIRLTNFDGLKMETSR